MLATSSERTHISSAKEIVESKLAIVNDLLQSSKRTLQLGERGILLEVRS